MVLTRSSTCEDPVGKVPKRITGRGRSRRERPPRQRTLIVDAAEVVPDVVRGHLTAWLPDCRAA